MNTKTLFIFFHLLILSSLTAFSQDITGIWSGTLKTPANTEITFIFSIENTDSGLHSTMAVPTLGASNLKPQKTIFEGKELFIDASNLGMQYRGIMNDTTGQIAGIYEEGGMKLSLTLAKGMPELKNEDRMQTPKEPYPYHTEEVVFENSSANVNLAGTFSKPKGKGRFPVVILISGSGRHDRDGTMARHRPFLVLSDYLTKQGIAVLRFDDRGFGDSTGDFDQATTADFAQDVLSAVDYLKNRSDIDIENIGLIGHSEGGIIAPMVARQSEDISFIVCLAATGISGKELTVMQSKSLRSFPVEDEESFEKNIRRAIDIILSDQNNELKRQSLRAHYESFWPTILRPLGAADENIKQFIDQEIEAALSPWKAFFLHHNPANDFSRLSIPVLSLMGDKDIQVDPSLNQSAIRNALVKGGNTSFKIITLEGVNHLIQSCDTGFVDEYSKIEETISPKAMQEISLWIETIIEAQP